MKTFLRQVSPWVFAIGFISSTVWTRAGNAGDFVGDVGGIRVEIIAGDMTALGVDAYVVPEFKGEASYGGVGAAVARRGGVAGLQAYDAYIAANGAPDFGQVVLTESGGGNARFHLHAVSVGSGAEREFAVVSESIVNALQAAAEKGIHSIAVPALGTGIIGQLTGEQSAQAILSAVHRYAEQGGGLDRFQIVIFNDRRATGDFEAVLKRKSYVGVSTAIVGNREFDPSRWVAGMAVMTRTIDELGAKPSNDSCERLLETSGAGEKPGSKWNPATWFRS